MTVTVLYPEDRQILDLALEQEVFGAEDFLLKREIGDLAVFGVQHGNGHRRGS